MSTKLITRRCSSMIAVALALALAAPVAGCTGAVRYHATARASTPDLVLISPGVYVIADHHESIFYNGGWYWRYSSGAWYRSRDYDGGWVVYREPPRVIARIERPHGYVHYRGKGKGKAHGHHRARERDHRAGDGHDRGRERDHRSSNTQDRRSH